MVEVFCLRRLLSTILPFFFRKCKMTSKRVLPTIGFLLALLVLFVLYFTSSKMEYKEPKMLIMLSKKEDVGLHRMAFNTDPFQTLTNSKL